MIIRYTIEVPDAIFYSRQSGNWNETPVWSFDSHDGPVSGFVPGPGSTVRIGGSNFNNHTVTLVEDILIEDEATLTVTETIDGAGILATNGFIVGGSGTFHLEKGGSLQIQSPDGITLSGNSGTIQTDTRTFSDEANYIFSGTGDQATGNALPQDVNNLYIQNGDRVISEKSHRINGTLSLQSGAFVVSDGFSLIANNQQITGGELTYQLEITGQRGYRMLSSPVAASFGNFLSGVLTQGYTGASLSGDLQPNVLWYDESIPGTDNQRWRAPGNSADPVVPGQGYHVYMFGDIPEDSRYNDPLPYLLEVNGPDHNTNGGGINMNVTYTAVADTGWNMVGNPFGAAIDWDHPSWTKTNIDSQIYVWDPNSNQYLTWNGSTGDIQNGIIAPFQAFWVKANGENPELTVNKDARTFGGSFAGKEIQSQVPSISISAKRSRRFQSSVHLTFSETGSFRIDQKDAHKLLPPPGVVDYLEMFSVAESGERLAINNLPRRFGSEINIPLRINSYLRGNPAPEDIDLKINQFENIPDGWTLTIVDEQTGNHYDIRKNETISVSMGHVKAKSSQSLPDASSVVTKNKNSHIKLTLIIDPGRDADDLPQSFKLHQNYPNPFNPTTTFRFQLPRESSVRIEIFDMLGRRVSTLVNKSLQAGEHEKVWDASGLSTGTYIARMVTNGGVLVRKLTLLK